VWYNAFISFFTLRIRNTTVASAGKTYIVYIIYMYATQQDAPHRNEVVNAHDKRTQEGMVADHDLQGKQQFE
jgi:hypothetical protein